MNETESLQVAILSNKLIRPSNPTPHYLKNFKLSLFDQLAPPSYVHILFYSSSDEDYICNRGKNDERCAKLEKTLSRVLTKFYPLAGRFADDNVSIDCADQRVEYFEAQVIDVNLAEFLQQGPADIEILLKFLPWDLPPAPCPLLAIQINKFDCGGLILGIQISHAIADACTMIAFVNEWANTSNEPKEMNKVLSSLCSDYFLSLFPARSTLTTGPKLPMLAKKPAAKIVTQRFLFDERIILLAKIFGEKFDSISSWWNFHPTRVVVVSAMLWKALIGVSLAKHGYLRDSILALAMNLRGKTGLPISEISCGNFWTSIVVPLEAKNGNMELQELIVLLSKSLESTYKKLATASIDDISAMRINSRREIIEKRDLCDDVDVYICTSWCRFPMYEVDFGWGKPYWVSQTSKAFEGISLMDAKNGQGIEAWISKEEKDMIELKREIEILTSLLI